MSLVRIVSTTTALTSLVWFAAACSATDSGGNGNGGNPNAGGSTSGGISGSLGGKASVGGGASQSGGTGVVGSGGSGNPGSGGTSSSSGGSTAGGKAATGGASASGGTTGTSGGAAGSGAQAGSTAGSGPLGGYHVYGDWAGFAFTYADGGATITPDKATGFKTMTDKDGPYCAKGSILGTADYSSSAAVGFNTKQDKIEDAPTGKIVPSGTGLLVNISNPGKSASLRVQIEDGTDPKATDAALHRWCVNISEFDKDIVIPWASFNTECWAGGKGTAFSPTTQLAKALVFLPSDGKTTLNFDFCVNKIGPDKVTGRGTGTLGSSCGNTVSWSSSNITGQYDNVATGDGKYHFQSNGWGWQGGGSHTVGLSTSCGFKMNSQTCSRTDKIPCSYPSIYIGTSADGKKSSGNGLPKLVSAITSAPVCMGWSSGGGSASEEYNVSFDVWFNSNASATNADTFLMVWYRKPPSFQPAGAPKADGVVIAGQPWTVWYGPNADNQNVVSYLAPTTFADGQSFSFDLKDFIDDAVQRNYISTSKNLISVFGGMEIWGGGSGAAITNFKAEVK